MWKSARLMHSPISSSVLLCCNNCVFHFPRFFFSCFLPFLYPCFLSRSFHPHLLSLPFSTPFSPFPPNNKALKKSPSTPINSLPFPSPSIHFLPPFHPHPFPPPPFHILPTYITPLRSATHQPQRNLLPSPFSPWRNIPMPKRAPGQGSHSVQSESPK